MSVNGQLGLFLHMLFRCCITMYTYIMPERSSSSAFVWKSVTCSSQYQLNNFFELLSLVSVNGQLDMFLRILFCCCVTMYTYIKCLNKQRQPLFWNQLHAADNTRLNNSLELISLCVLMDNLVCFFTCFFVVV